MGTWTPAWCAVIASLVMGGCLAFGSCSETEAFAFNSLRHYGDAQLVPEPQPNGSCGASLVTGDDPDAVIEHYRSELQRVGFVLSSLESSPIVDEPEAAVGRTLVFRGPPRRRPHGSPPRRSSMARTPPS